MRLENSEVILKRGIYSVVTDINGGTSISLEISVNGMPFKTVENGLFTTDVTRQFIVPYCKVRTISIGGAYMELNLIQGPFTNSK